MARVSRKAKELLAASGDNDLVDEAEAEDRPEAAEHKPELSELLSYFEELRAIKLQWDTMATRERERIHLKDTLPMKWQRNLQDGRRFYSRISYNEIKNRVRQQVANLPECTILPDGMEQSDFDKAEAQTKFAQELMPAMERLKPGFRTRAVDSQLSIGLAAYEVCLTGSYDDLDYEAREGETAHQVLMRNEKEARKRKPPFEVRMVDGQSLFLDDYDNPNAGFIYELKPWRTMSRKYKGLGDRIEPDPGVLGAPGGDTSNPGFAGTDTCETLRYYDEWWYAYIVNGKFVDGPRPHGITGGMPVFPFKGVIGAMAQLERGTHGIMWGVESGELLINDVMTLEADNVFVYSRPKWVIETPLGGTIMPAAPGQQQPGSNGAVLDLREPLVRQLNPGQTLVNATKDFVPFQSQVFLNTALALMARNLQNPVAQGESPGASPAGYTVATLTGNATAPDVDQVKNEAVAWGLVVDCCRRIVRDTIQHPVWIAVPMEENGTKSLKWMKLDPDDVTEVACISEIDPDNPATRLANRQSWMEGHASGFVPRREVQKRAFDASDPDQWDYEIIRDKGKEIIAQLAIEMAVQEVRAFGQPPPPPVGPDGQPTGLVGPDGKTPISSATSAPGGAPADPNPPTVGPKTAAASQAGSSFKANDAQQKAGQGGTYTPAVQRW